METLGNDFVAKNGKEVAKKYYCEKCNYECSKIVKKNLKIGLVYGSIQKNVTMKKKKENQMNQQIKN